MVSDELTDDIPVSMGVGRIQISSFPIILPLFFINFGKNQSSLTEQFAEYENITLTIEEVNPFTFRYQIHSDILLYTITKEIMERVEKGEDVKDVLREYPGSYSFQVSQDIKRHWHSLFEETRTKTHGTWVLLLHGTTSNFILIDEDGQILERTEMPRRELPGITDQLTP